MYVESLEGSPYDPICSLYDSLQILPLCLCGVLIPDSDVCGEDAPYQSSVGMDERVMVQAFSGLFSLWLWCYKSSSGLM